MRGRPEPRVHASCGDTTHQFRRCWCRRAGHDAPARLVQERGRPELFLSMSSDTIESFLTAEVSRGVAPRTSPAVAGLPHWL